MRAANRVVLVFSWCAVVGLAAGMWPTRPHLRIDVDPQNMLVAELVSESDGPVTSRPCLIIYGMRIANTGSRPIALESVSLCHEHQGRALESAAMPTRTTLLSNSEIPSLVIESGKKRLVLTGWNDLALALRAAQEFPVPGGATLDVSVVFPLDECAQCAHGLIVDRVALRMLHSSGWITTLPIELPPPTESPLADGQPATDS